MMDNKLMLFSECLGGLLTATDLKCKKLAQQLNFEYSTVYKWKGGQRIPPVKNYKDILKNMTDIFAAIAREDEVCYRRILLMLKKYNEGLETFEKQELKIEVNDLTEFIYKMLFSSYQNSKSIMDNEKDIDNISFKNYSLKNKINSDKMFFGSKEVTLQVFNLLKEGIKSRNSKDKPIIYLNITNRIDSNIDMPGTEDTYIKYICKLLESGWHIDMALCIDKYKHNWADFSNILTNFFPMVPKKEFSLNYLYMDSSKRQIDSVLIIPEVGAVITFSLDDWAGNDFCCVIKDTEAIKLLYNYYSKRIDNTRPLYIHKSFNWYLEAIRFSQQAGEDNMVVTQGIGVVMMPKAELEYFVKSVWSNRFSEKFDLNLYVEDTVRFYDTISGNKYQHVMSKSEISDYIRNGFNKVMGFECKTSVDQRIRHLEHILEIIEGNSNVELLLLDDAEFELLKGLTININSSNKALLNILKDTGPNPDNEKLGFMMVTEPFIVTGLKSMFMRVWENPSNNAFIRRGSTDWLKSKINWLKEIKNT